MSQKACIMMCAILLLFQIMVHHNYRWLALPGLSPLPRAVLPSAHGRRLQAVPDPLAGAARGTVPGTVFPVPPGGPCPVQTQAVSAGLGTVELHELAVGVGGLAGPEVGVVLAAPEVGDVGRGHVLALAGDARVTGFSDHLIGRKLEQKYGSVKSPKSPGLGQKASLY